MNFSILGTGHVLPELVVSNDDLAKRVDTSDEWIRSRTGINERRILSDKSLTDISVQAAQSALENANVAAEDLDLIIYSTILGDLASPSMACVVAAKIGAACPAFDINAACTGFIYALDVAAGYFARKKAKNILIICGERLSRVIDWNDRVTCVIFGDGAGAVVLGEGDSLLSISIGAKPDDQLIRIPSAHGDSPYYEMEKEAPYMKMNGQEVYKFAVNTICNDIPAAIKDAGLEEKDVDYIFLHQANIRIIETAIGNLKIPREKYVNNIERTGNISSASIPILLDEMNRGGRLKRGDILVFSAFGAGLTMGSAVVRW